MKKMILRSCKLREISGVDRPAQSPATMTIIKREEPGMDKKEFEALQKKVGDLTKALDSATKKADLTDAEKGYMNGLKKEDQDSFLALSAEDRKAQMEMSKRADEVLEIDGVVLVKSSVGEEMFEVIKSQQAEIQKQAQEVTKARELAIQAGFVRKASSDYSHLPGTADEIGTLLRETANISKGAKATLDTVLTSLEKMNASTFISKGHGGGENEGTPALEKLDTLAKNYAEANGVDYETAYSAVLEKNQNLWEEVIN